MDRPRLGFVAVFLFIVFSLCHGFADIDVIPPRIKRGFEATENLLVNCTYTGSIPIETLSVVRIEKVEIELVAFRNFSSGDVINSADLPSGSTFNDGEYFLEINIPDPGLEYGGVYGCKPGTVNEDDQGRVRPSYQFVPVGPYDPRSFVDRYNNLTDEFDDLSDEFENIPDALEPLNFTGEITRLEEVNANLSTSINEAKEQIADIETQIAQAQLTLDEADTVQVALDNALFFKSEVYRNRRYHLSTYSPTSFKHAEEICELRGGYLAELDDSMEYEEISLFLRPYISQQQYVLFGAVLNSDGSTYSYRHSGNALSFSTFFPNTPNGQDVGERCLALVMNWQGHVGLKMEDVDCHFVSENEYGYYPAFLCEVPESTSPCA